MVPPRGTRSLTLRAALLACVVTARTVTGGEPDGKLITAVRLERAEVEQFSRVDVEIDVSADYFDPFDPQEVRLDAIIDLPGGKSVILPCFYDTGEPAAARWGARFTPSRTGGHTLRIRAACGGREEISAALTVQVQPSFATGFLHLRSDSDWTLVDSGGQPFRGVGINYAWEARRRRDRDAASASYESMFTALRERGANIVRTWMCPWNLPLEWNTVAGREYRPDDRTYNRSAIERLDALFDTAARHGIYIVLVLDYHGALKTEIDTWGGNNYWSAHPYNRANGGPCETPRDFFTHPGARRLYRNRLRYLVARWGHSPHLAAWELWNEVDHVMDESRIPPEAIVAWHREMAAHLQQIDPYDHLVTTSVSHRPISGLFEVDGIDLAQAHVYGPSRRIPEAIASLRRSVGKPAMVGEFARDWRAPGRETGGDTERELHLGLWRGLFNPTPILPMSWWWDYLERRGALEHLRHVATFQQRVLEAGSDPVRLEIDGGDDLEVAALRAGGEVFAWIRNRSDRILEGRAIDLPVDLAGPYDVGITDAWTGKHLRSSRIEAHDSALQLAIAPLGVGESLAVIVTPANAFTLVVLPDTQCYADTRLRQSEIRWGRDLRKYFFCQTDWIRDNAGNMNVRFVVHEGDITQTDDDGEWAIARQAMATLDGRVPYCLCLGNHDMGYRKTEGSPTSYRTAADRKTGFNRFFPRSDFEHLPGFGGTFGETHENSYRLFEAAGRHFMIVSLEFKPRDAVLEWAGRIVREHPDHRVIVLTHAYLDSSGKRIAHDAYAVEGNSGEQMWQKLVSRHPNIFLVLCGHRLGEARLTSTGEQGNRVHQLLCDYQGLPDGGSSWLRYLTFFPAANRIRVSTFNPWRGVHRLNDASRFELEYDMTERATNGRMPTRQSAGRSD